MGTTISAANIGAWSYEIERFYNISAEDLEVLEDAAMNIPGFAQRVEHILDDVYYDSDSEETNIYNDLSNTDAEKEVALKMLAEDVRGYKRGF